MSKQPDSRKITKGAAPGQPAPTSESGSVLRFPTPAIPIEEALAIIEAKGATQEVRLEVSSLIETYLRRELAAVGNPLPTEVEASLQSQAKFLTDALGEFDDESGFVSPEFARMGVENWLHNTRYHYGIGIEFSKDADLYSRGLTGYFLEQLRDKLILLGFEPSEAENTARNIFRSIRVSAGPSIQLNDRAQVDIYVDLIAASALTLKGQAKASFGLVAPLQSTEAPARWVDRDRSQFPTAESFLCHHYGPRLGIEGDLTLADVGRLDTSLHTALNKEFKARRGDLHHLLPTATMRADQRLEQKYGYIPRGADRRSKLTALSLRDRPSP